jgi:hypothetical protein
VFRVVSIIQGFRANKGKNMPRRGSDAINMRVILGYCLPAFRGACLGTVNNVFLEREKNIY